MFNGRDARQKPEKVLIVDADLTHAREVGAALRSRGYFAVEATSFEEAKVCLSSERPEILIADVRLGRFNGLHLLLRARADRPDVRAVITSAVPDVVLEAEARRLGGAFLVKSDRVEKTVAALLDVLNKKRGGRHPPGHVGAERRKGDRRQVAMPFFPDRRMGERRRPRL